MTVPEMSAVRTAVQAERHRMRQEEEEPEEDITVPAEDEYGTGSEPPAGGEGTDAAPPAQPGGTDVENTAKDAAVETGDETVIMPYGVILFLSACVVLVTALAGRKSKR